MAFTIVQPDPQRLSALAVRQGLKAIKLGARLTRVYTPARCMARAAEITGKRFKARDYDGAIAALDAWLEENQ